MSDRYEAIKQRLQKSRETIHALCQPRGYEGSREWIMSIPAQPERDPDMILAATVRDVSALLEEVERYREALRVIASYESSGGDPLAEWMYMINKAREALEGEDDAKTTETAG